MKVWITRTAPAAARTAGRVRDLGHDPLIAPLLAVKLVPAWAGADVRPENTQALAFTSQNGVEAFVARPDGRSPAWRKLPVYVVGGATAAAARQAGFMTVLSAEGDVDALRRLILDHAVRGGGGGAVLHAGPSERAGKLVSDLRAGGVWAQSVVVYGTVPQPPPMWPSGEGPDAVLLHSPKAAAVLADLADGGPLTAMTAFCISENAARALRGLFPAVYTAHAPTEAALLALLGKPAAAG